MTGGWIVRSTLCLAVSGLVGSSLPASAYPADPTSAVRGLERPSPELGAKLRLLQQMRAHGLPQRIADLLLMPLEPDDAKVRRGRSIQAFATGDMTGDGVPDVVEYELRYRIELAEGQDVNEIVSERYRSILRLRHGRNGRLRWTKRFDDLVIVPSARVGEKGAKGFVVIGGLFSFFYNGTGEKDLTFEAIRGGDGRRLWTKRYTSVVARRDFTTVVATDTPVSIGLLQARKDRATEILLGLSTLTDSLYSTTAVTRTVLLSGADGSDVAHPQVDVGIDWLPYPDATSDLDGDHLDDYVVINDKGFAAGGGQDPPSLGGTIYARSGLDGTPVWTTSGLEFRWFAWAVPLANVAGNPRRELGILTFNTGRSRSVVPDLPLIPSILSFRPEFEVGMLVDGGSGRHLWTKRASWLRSPGDIDRDGDPDLLLEHIAIRWSKNRIDYDRVALPGTGRRLWRHAVRLEGPPCVAKRCLMQGAGWGLGSSGDVHPDRVDDGYLHLILANEFGESEALYIPHGRKPKMQIRTKRPLEPLLAPVDASGDDFAVTGFSKSSASVKTLTGTGLRDLWRARFRLDGSILRGLSDRFSWAEAIELPGDRCADVLVNLVLDENTFYAVLDGSTGEVRWSRWSADGGRPRPTGTRGTALC